MAVHYYNEEEVSFTKNQNCTIVTNLSDQTKENLEKKAEEEFKQAKSSNSRRRSPLRRSA